MNSEEILYSENNFPSIYKYSLFVIGVAALIIGFISEVYLFILGLLVLILLLPLVISIPMYYKITLTLNMLTVGKESISTGDIVSINIDQTTARQSGKLFGGAYGVSLGQSLINIALQDGRIISFGSYHKDKLAQMINMRI